MKRHIGIVTGASLALIAFVGFNLLPSGTAQAQTTNDCVHAPTIASLEMCVEHAASQGLITNQGVTQSLLAKLDAAEEELPHGQKANAINKLKAFIDEVQAQSGKHIDSMHAQHMVMHAQMVIQQLQNG